MTLPTDLNRSTEKLAKQQKGARSRPPLPYWLLMLAAASGGAVCWQPGLAGPISTVAAVLGVAGVKRRR
jgi:hypothetical protein